MRRRPPRSTPLYSSAASDVYKRQDLDGEVHAAEAPGNLVAVPRRRQARVDPKTLELGPDAEDVLGHSDVAPAGRPGQPRVAGLAEPRRRRAVGELAVHVRLDLVD